MHLVGSNHHQDMHEVVGVAEEVQGPREPALWDIGRPDEGSRDSNQILGKTKKETKVKRKLMDKS